MVPTHWLLRVGDGSHFFSSQPLKRWGVNSKHTNCVPSFLRDVKSGDILWFIQSENDGKVIGVAEFRHHCHRELGPLIAVTPTNEDLGWVNVPGEWDTEVHYTALYDTVKADIYTKIKSPLVIRRYNPEKCVGDLPEIHANIVRFSRATLV
jgi:hypothetical protein